MSRFVVNPDYYTVEPQSDDPIIQGGLTRVKKLNVYYIDINSSYKIDTKGIIVYDDDVVNMQIANIFATPIGSDDFEPTFGSNLPYRLFDPITDLTSYLMFNDSIGALTTWMQNPGRLVINSPASYIRPINNDPDTEGYEIKISYALPQVPALSFFQGFILR